MDEVVVVGIVDVVVTAFVVVVADDVVVVDADELAFENDIVLRQITPVRPTLEETFFTMTEEER